MARLHLRFDARRVEHLVRHAEAHTPLVTSARYRREPSYWKPGALPDEQGLVRADDVDVARVPRYVILTREEGLVFLVAGTAEKLPDLIDPAMHCRVYAEGYGPGSGDRKALSSVVGDTNFAEDLDLRWFADARHAGCRYVRLSLSETTIHLLAAEFEPVAASRTTANRSRRP